MKKEQMWTQFINEEIGPNECQMTSNEGHWKSGWRIESLALPYRLSNSKESAPEHSVPYSPYYLHSVSAEQQQLSYYINDVNLNCIGSAILFSFNLQVHMGHMVV